MTKAQIAQAVRIVCDIDNGVTGDGRLALAMREVRDCVPGADQSREIIPAIETNGDPIGILVDSAWTMGEGAVDLAVAADMLGTTPQAIRAAVLAAWPAAVEWDWAVQSCSERRMRALGRCIHVTSYGSGSGDGDGSGSGSGS